MRGIAHNAVLLKLMLQNYKNKKMKYVLILLTLLLSSCKSKDNLVLTEEIEIKPQPNILWIEQKI